MAGNYALHAEFDEKNRILHVEYLERVHIRTGAQIDDIFSNIDEKLAGLCSSGRIYLIINMTNLVIEPSLTGHYARHARAICNKYILPDGVARYGYQITRITVKRGYDEYLGTNPNIFNSREEAFRYIHAVREKNERMQAAMQTPTWN